MYIYIYINTWRVTGHSGIIIVEILVLSEALTKRINVEPFRCFCSINPHNKMNFRLYQNFSNSPKIRVYEGYTSLIANKNLAGSLVLSVRSALSTLQMCSKTRYKHAADMNLSLIICIGLTCRSGLLLNSSLSHELVIFTTVNDSCNCQDVAKSVRTSLTSERIFDFVSGMLLSAECDAAYTLKSSSIFVCAVDDYHELLFCWI